MNDWDEIRKELGTLSRQISEPSERTAARIMRIRNALLEGQKAERGLERAIEELAGFACPGTFTDQECAITAMDLRPELEDCQPYRDRAACWLSYLLQPIAGEE